MHCYTHDYLIKQTSWAEQTLLSPFSLQLLQLQKVFADHLPVLLPSPSNTQMLMSVLSLTGTTSEGSLALLPACLESRRHHYHCQTTAMYHSELWGAVHAAAGCLSSVSHPDSCRQHGSGIVALMEARGEE